MAMRQADDQEQRHISAARVIIEFRTLLQHKRIAPLTMANFNIQHDAFARAADDDTDDEEIASFVCNTKETDEQFRFALGFYKQIYIVSIEDFADISYEYDSFGDEKALAKELIKVLVSLANGQCGILLTRYKDKPCAVELFMREKDSTRMQTVATMANFPVFAGGSPDDQNYSVQRKMNRFIHEDIHLGDTYLLAADPEESRHSSQRTITNHNIEPLTRFAFETRLRDAQLARAGKKDDQSSWAFMYSSWELWFTALLFGSILLFIPDSSPNPAIQLLSDQPIIIGVVAMMFFWLAVLPQMKQKETLKAARPHHPYAVADRLFGAAPFRAVGFIASIICFVGLFLPVYYLKDFTQPSSFLSIVTSYNQSWMWLAVIGFALVPVLYYSKNLLARIANSLLVFVAFCTFGYMLEAYTKADAPTVEPITSIVSACVVITLFAVILQSFTNRKPFMPTSTERSQQTVQRATLALAITSFVAGLCFVIAAYLFGTQTPAGALYVGNGPLLGLVTLGMALVYVYYGCMLLYKRYAATNRYIVLMPFFASLFLIGFNFKSEDPDPVSAFILVLVGAMLQLSMAGVLEVLWHKQKADEIVHRQ